VSESRRSFITKISSLFLAIFASGSARAELAGKQQAPKIVALSADNLYARGGKDYEAQRRAAVWQAIKPERYPDLIVRASDEADIVDTVNYARANKLPISVRCGGHSYVASPLRKGGILLDVSGMRELTIDAPKRQAEVQPGVISAEFSARLEPHGLGFPIAHCPTVSLGGYLLGGGMGWNGVNWGQFACFNVSAVDLITASGERIHASENSHKDLFWAARGAGPAFCAIVSKYYLDVFPRPQAITSSTYIYKLDALEEIISWLEEYKAKQSEKIELTVIFSTSKKEQSTEDSNKRQCIISAVCFADDEAEAAELLAAIAAGAPKKACVYCAEYQSKTMQDLLAASVDVIPHRHAVDTLWTSQSAPVLKQIGEHFLESPSPETHVFANYRASSTLKPDAAYSVSAPMFILSSSTWAEQKNDEECLRWSDGLMERLQRYNEGAYVNETDFIRHPERARQCFSESSWSRIKTVSEQYDPDAMFSAPFDLG
jgi:hypothetical protein